MSGIDLAKRLRNRAHRYPDHSDYRLSGREHPGKGRSGRHPPRPAEAPSRGKPCQPHPGRHPGRLGRRATNAPEEASGKLLRVLPLRYRAKFSASITRVEFGHPPQRRWPCSPNRSTPPIIDQGCSGPASKPDQFCALTGHAGLVASEFSYRKDEEIYGEDEPAEYVYQVIRGAVRTYKLLSDGRRQIGAFLLPGDVFGLEIGQQPSPRGRSHRRHHGAPGEAPQP